MASLIYNFDVRCKHCHKTSVVNSHDRFNCPICYSGYTTSMHSSRIENRVCKKCKYTTPRLLVPGEMMFKCPKCKYMSIIKYIKRVPPKSVSRKQYKSKLIIAKTNSLNTLANEYVSDDKSLVAQLRNAIAERDYDRDIIIEQRRIIAELNAKLRSLI